MGGMLRIARVVVERPGPFDGNLDPARDQQQRAGQTLVVGPLASPTWRWQHLTLSVQDAGRVSRLPDRSYEGQQALSRQPGPPRVPPRLQPGPRIRLQRPQPVRDPRPDLACRHDRQGLARSLDGPLDLALSLQLPHQLQVQLRLASTVFAGKVAQAIDSTLDVLKTYSRADIHGPHVGVFALRAPDRRTRSVYIQSRSWLCLETESRSAISRPMTVPRSWM